MGVSENPAWRDSRLTLGKAFDGTWSTTLASVRDVKEPATAQVLPGDAQAGEALVIDPRVPMVAFTGSPAVGRRIGALAGEHLKDAPPPFPF